MKSNSKRGLATKAKILDAAATRIIKFGVNGTSVDEILNDSGTGKSQFYHYFGSKELMVLELIEHLANSLSMYKIEVLEAIKNKKDLDAWLLSFAKGFETGNLKYGCPIGNIANEMVAISDPIRLSIEARFSAWIAEAAKMLLRLHKSGEVVLHQTPSQTAELIFQTIQGSLLHAKVRGQSHCLQNLAVNINRYLSSERPERIGASSSRPGKALKTGIKRHNLGFCP